MVCIILLVLYVVGVYVYSSTLSGKNKITGSMSVKVNQI
jgi:hypothetical protein